MEKAIEESKSQVSISEKEKKESIEYANGIKCKKWFQNNGDYNFEKNCLVQVLIFQDNFMFYRVKAHEYAGPTGLGI